MRAKEFIIEDASSSNGSGTISNGRKTPFNKQQQAVIPGAIRYPGIAAHYYDMYRFGVHMAGSPGDQNMDPSGPTANQMVTLAYSSTDLDIIKKSAKELGLIGAQITSHGSRETDDTNIISPVSNWNKK